MRIKEYTECGARFDGAHSTISVGQVGRDYKFSFLANTHTIVNPINIGKYSNNPWSHPLMTCPAPSLNSNGVPLSLAMYIYGLPIIRGIKDLAIRKEGTATISH